MTLQDMVINETYGSIGIRDAFDIRTSHDGNDKA